MLLDVIVLETKGEKHAYVHRYVLNRGTKFYKQVMAIWLKLPR